MRNKLLKIVCSKIVSLAMHSKVTIIIIILSRPGANTTKYNHQWDNLLMGHVQTVHGNTLCADHVEKMHRK